MIQVLYMCGMAGFKVVPKCELTFSVTPKAIREVTFGGWVWQEYEIDKSCTMSVSGQSPDNCAIWLCGGGGGGCTGSGRGGGGGGGGGYCAVYTGVISRGSIIIGAGGAPAILNAGAAAGTTTVKMSVSGGMQTLTALGGLSSKNAIEVSTGGDGGSGGGTGGTSAVGVLGGVGSGSPTIPFSDSVNWRRLCAGGGGGGRYHITASYRARGGAGGSNGANGGENSLSSTDASKAGGVGGTTGGGKGGTGGVTAETTTDGSAATDYGGGGGGGAECAPNSATTYITDGGAGYQGVAILRIPMVQTA